MGRISTIIMRVLSLIVKMLLTTYRHCVSLLPNKAQESCRKAVSFTLSLLSLQRVSSQDTTAKSGIATAKGGSMYRNNDPILANIFQDTEEFYTKVKSIYEKTGYSKSYPLNEFWGGANMENLIKTISSHTGPVDKIAAIHETRMFSVNTADEELKNKVVDWYIEYLHAAGVSLDSLDVSIQESPISNPRNSVLRGERLLAPDFLRTVIRPGVHHPPASAVAHGWFPLKGSWRFGVIVV